MREAWRQPGVGEIHASNPSEIGIKRYVHLATYESSIRVSFPYSKGTLRVRLLRLSADDSYLNATWMSIGQE